MTNTINDTPVNNQQIQSHQQNDDNLVPRRYLSKKHGGYTITEFAIVFIIVTIIAAIAYGVLGPYMTSSRANGLQSELSTFQMKIREAYNGQDTGYTGISVAEVIKSHAYPTNLNSNGTTLTSSNTGSITISSDDGNGQSFSIQYGAVPTGVCQSIISKLTSAGGWNEIDVGGSAIWSGTSTTPKKSDIDTQCGTKSTVVMKFISN